MNRAGKELKVAGRLAVCLVRRCILRLHGPGLRLLLCFTTLLLPVQPVLGGILTYDIASTSCSGGWSAACGAMIHWMCSSASCVQTCPFTDTAPTGALVPVSATMYWNTFYSASGNNMTVRLNGNIIYGPAAATTITACDASAVVARTTTIAPAYIVKGGANSYTFTTNADAWSGISPGPNMNGYNVQPIIRTVVTYADISSTVTAPAQASFVSTATPTFTWATTGSAAATFNLQVSSEAFFVGTGLINKNLGAVTSYKLTGTSPEVLVNGQGYYARVRVTNGFAGDPWSYVNDFSVELSSPPAPVLTSPGTDYPAQPEVIGTQKPRFDWGLVTAPH